jgi:hypothetical protein
MTTTLNQSKVKMFRRCQKQFAFRYDYAPAGRELIPLKKKLPLYRGSWMHALQEALHYQWAGFDEFTITFGEGKQMLKIDATCWQDVQEVLAEQFDQMFDEEKEDLGDLATDTERLFKSYLRFWQHDQETYTVAEYNGEPMIEFTLEVPLPGIDSIFKGRIDLVVEDEEFGGFWIWDAKWVKSIPPPEERMMSPQSILYLWALREHYNLDVRGFVYNYGRTKPPTIPAVLKRPAGMLTTRKSIDTDYYTYLRAIKDNHGKNWRRYIDYYKPKLQDLKGREALWFRRERIPIEEGAIDQAVLEFIASGKQINDRLIPQSAPRSYFYNCKFGCDYHTLCVGEFQGLNIKPLIKHGYQIVGERYGEQLEDLLSA